MCIMHVLEQLKQSLEASNKSSRAQTLIPTEQPKQYYSLEGKGLFDNDMHDVMFRIQHSKG